MQQILAFEIGGQRFAVALGDVREIVRAVQLSRLPKAPAIVEGVFNLRGTLVPVLDIRARFGLQAKAIEPADSLVVARTDGRIVALRVDHVIDLLTLNEDEIEGVQQHAPGSDYVAGVAKLPDGLVLIHDLATFLSVAETASLDTSLGAMAG
jgi:purine-binding chemotaxis protein CheW